MVDAPISETADQAVVRLTAENQELRYRLIQVRSVLNTCLGDTDETLKNPLREDVLKRKIALINEALNH